LNQSDEEISFDMGLLDVSTALLQFFSSYRCRCHRSAINDRSQHCRSQILSKAMLLFRPETINISEQIFLLHKIKVANVNRYIIVFVYINR